MKTNMKRLLALILALSMVMSLLSTSAWAADTSADGSEDPAVSSAEPQEEPQEETQEETAPEPEEEEEEAQEEEPPEAEPEAEGEESEEEAKEAAESEEEAEEAGEAEETPAEEPEKAEQRLTAQGIANTWSEATSYSETQTLNGGVAVTADITLTIAEGATLTVNGGINATGHTLTVAGKGTLVVTGADGEDGDYYDDGTGGDGSAGGDGFTGDIIVNGATVNITGGNSGNGGNAHAEGKNGGNGGNGGNGISGNITVNSGSATLTGGSGGDRGIGWFDDFEGTGFSGSEGSVGKAVTGTITGFAQEKDDNSTWTDVTSGTSSKRYVKVEAAVSDDPYSSLLNTTTVVKFDNKDWYLIENNSTAANAGTVTLLSKECVGASKYNSSGSYVEYASSTVKTAVDNYYTNSISSNVKTAIVDNKMFLLTTDQANTIMQANPEVLKCNKANGADDNAWWLCSPGGNASSAACVYGGIGSVDGTGGRVKRTIGVRPALKLDLSKVTFDSETNTFTVGSAATAHTHDDITFTAWDSDNSLPTESGSYYLTQDVTLSGTWNVPTGETNLCLNGHSIILSGSGSVISVPEGATLNLYDCDETTHYVTLTGGRGTDVSTTQPNGTEGTNYLKVTGGCITGGTGTSNNGRYYGGGVFVSGTFNMYGGNIVGNTVSIYGGGVYVNGGTFEMQGGKITGNTATYGGGGVYVSGTFNMPGTFNMTGGNIVGNKTGGSGSGGGVYVNRGSFNLSGGSITGNTASTGNGGGVYNGGTFTMEGGSITGNTASGNGGGVLNEGGTFTMTGGSITGNTAGKKGGGVYVNSDGTFNVSGAPVIKDNTKGTGESAPKNNVYLYDSKITVNGALSGSAEVGVTMKTPGVFTSSADPIKASGYKDCFSSDDSTYTVTTDGNELKLSSHEHDFTYSATGATITATCTVDGCALPPSSQGGTDHVAKLTIAAPTLGTYGQTGDGISAEATVTDASSIKGNATVVYKKGDETLSSAPTNAGTYTASITVGGATASVEYTIAQKEVTVSGITASDKVYDGNTDATLVTTAATVTGKLDGDALTVSATGTFDNANVGENKTVTISELTFGGSSKDNYKLASTGSQTTTTAKITAKAVGLTWSNTELAYTGEAQKPTATATGVVDGDTCTVTVSGEQTNVGDDYTATAASLSNSNYKLPENKTTTFKIVKGNAVPVTVTANNRTYDGTEKPLVTVTGEATGGEMQYALGTATEATGSYTTSIPAKTDAGTYYVWYKVKGDGNHNDTEPKPISVTISNPAPSHTHNWGDWEVTKKATCVAKGEKKRTCSDCKKEEKQEIDIDPANHVNTEIRDAKEATETEEGYTGDTWCKDCDVKLESGKTIPKLEKKQEEKTETQKEDKKAFTDFRTLRLVAKRGTKSVNLTWRKYADADGYLIYGCECGAGSKMKLLKTIKGNKTVKWTQKKLKKGTYYKYKVVAYKNNKGKKQTLVTSKEAHTVTHDGKTTAVKAVKVNKTSVSLKKGKTFQIKASEVKENKNKKIDHHREISYESSNKKIATVAKNGKVKGVKKGTATIFVYSETGSYKTVKVTVK